MTNNTCECTELRSDRKFHSSRDFFKFMDQLKESDLFEKLPGERLYGNIGGLFEYHHKCKKCGTIWRLVEPDAPFAGVWEKVE